MTVAPPLRIVDFSTHMSGPLASQLLMQLGADVVKVENPRTGDGNRGLDPLIHGSGLFHVALNAGARSLAIDRHSPHWARIVAACARWADAVIVGGRPADAAKRGIDFASLVRANPRLVYSAISGYGEVGPWSASPAHGLNPDACAGLVPVEREHGFPVPLASYQSIGAPLAGVFAALGILAAVRERDHGCGARYVHVSIWESAMWFSWRHHTALANLQHPWPAYKDLGSRYAMYYTRDDRVILACPIERRFWERFCDLLELPQDWKTRGSWEATGMDNGLGRLDEKEAIARRMATRSLAEWSEALAANDIPFAPVLTAAEALASEHAAATGVMSRSAVLGQPVAVPSAPVRLRSDDGRPGAARDLPPPPRLGEHTAEILAEIGVPELADAI